MNHAHAPRPGDDREWISELVDGHGGPDQLAQGCEAWSVDAELRRTVYTYHLIGDVLRSDDLSGRPAADAAFLSALRARLADEPVVLAPGPVAAPTVRSHRPLWAVPVALAASVVVVAGVLVALEPQATGGVGEGALSQVARGPQPSPVVPVILDSSDMLRDAQVDEYLRLHRETLAGAPPALPGGALRSVGLQVTSPSPAPQR